MSTNVMFVRELYYMNVKIMIAAKRKTVFDFPKSQKIAPVLRWKACSDCLISWISRSISQHQISGSISQHQISRSISQHQNSGSISQYWICWKPLPSHQLIMVNNILDLQVYFPVLDLWVYFPAPDLQVYFPAPELWIYFPVLDLLETSPFPPINYG